VKFWLFAVFVFALLVVVSSIFIASAQPQEALKHFQVETPDGTNVRMSAENIEREMPGPVVKLDGNVEIRTKDMILNADEADYDINTADVEFHGRVHVKLARQH